jgi:glucose/arabinose dehydrogenase
MLSMPTSISYGGTFLRFKHGWLLFCLGLVCGRAAAGFGADLPQGFSESLVAGGLDSVTAMEFSPDGRLFVGQQNGELLVIKNLTLLAEPFIRLTTDEAGERGLLGVAFDPGFVTNQFVYLYYTTPAPVPHNRVSRFTANGDVALDGSEVPLLDLEELDVTYHNGGAIHFGGDGKLYIAVGENGVSANAQTLSNRLGKLLRINPDGSIPADNPFFSVASGVNRSIWALGLRNPYTFAVQRGTGRLLINDVGDGVWEEIDEGQRGANYGWPFCEGKCVRSGGAYRDPIFQYAHGDEPTNGCAITGGAFYDPVAPQFPSAFRGNYFFADICGNWIRRLAAQNRVFDFASNFESPVDVKVSAEGRLFYLSRNAGQVWRIDYTNTPPVLGITREGPGLTLLWPAPSSGYRLQTTAALLPNAAWANVSTPVLSTNGHQRVSITSTGAMQFFRLVK